MEKSAMSIGHIDHGRNTQLPVAWVWWFHGIHFTSNAQIGKNCPIIVQPEPVEMTDWR